MERIFKKDVSIFLGIADDTTGVTRLLLGIANPLHFAYLLAKPKERVSKILYLCTMIHGTGKDNAGVTNEIGRLLLVIKRKGKRNPDVFKKIFGKFPDFPDKQFIRDKAWNN